MSSPALTCITCRIFFQNPTDQRTHYKAELHQFNLQRKLKNEDPVSEETFVQLQNEIKKQNKERDQKKERRYCDTCNKGFASENSYNSHLGSKKHISLQNKTSETASVQSEKSEKTEDRYYPTNEIPEEYKHLDELDEDDKMLLDHISKAPKLEPTDCLFCIEKFKTVEKNLSHMESVHSFWIPDQEYVKEVEDLLKYLGQKISIGNTCLWCNDEFSSFTGVRRHMIAKCHCRVGIDFETQTEFDNFYDYSRDYGNNTEKEGASEKDKEISVESKLVIKSNGYDLVLGSGKTIGHRELKQYYKQYWRPSFHPEASQKQSLASSEEQGGSTEQSISVSKDEYGQLIPQRQWKSMQQQVQKIEERKKDYDMKLEIKTNYLPKHKIVWDKRR